MKKFKKAMALSLALAMGLSMVACGDKKDEVTTTVATESSETPGSEEDTTEAPTEEDTTEAPTEEDTTEEASDLPENVVSGDADAENAFVVWGWNDDIKNIIDGPYATDNADDYARIVFVNSGGSDYYQTKIDPLLQDASNKLYPDVLGLEIDYVQKYVQSGELLSMADIGITDDDLAQQYDFNVKVCSINGEAGAANQYASFWQATPGGWCLRADLCEKFLGTTDVGELTEMFSTWEKVEETAAKVYEASEGHCRLLSGYDDLMRIYTNSRATGWYDSNDVIQIDDQVKNYFEEAKKFNDNDWTFKTKQWDGDWNAMKDGDGVTSDAALAYTGCPWFLYWCLTDTWKGQTIVVPGPQSFYWGGTGLAATKNCSDPELAGRLIKYISCDAETMVKMVPDVNADYLNNKEANAKLAADANAQLTTGNGYMASQNYLEVFTDLLNNMTVDTSIVTAEDKGIIDVLNNYVEQYIKDGDYDAAIADLKAYIHDTYNYLNVE